MIESGLAAATVQGIQRGPRATAKKIRKGSNLKEGSSTLYFEDQFA